MMVVFHFNHWPAHITPKLGPHKPGTTLFEGVTDKGHPAWGSASHMVNDQPVRHPADYVTEVFQKSDAPGSQGKVIYRTHHPNGTADESYSFYNVDCDIAEVQGLFSNGPDSGMLHGGIESKEIFLPADVTEFHTAGTIRSKRDLPVIISSDVFLTGTPGSSLRYPTNALSNATQVTPGLQSSSNWSMAPEAVDFSRPTGLATPSQQPSLLGLKWLLSVMAR
jgi:hypothetical protein